MVLLDGHVVGRVEEDRRGRLSFTYDETWRSADDAYPLSLSMPLAAAEHAHAAIHSFLWGLLPDNEVVLQRWASRFQVSARNPFRLIAHVGEDCAGAIQFVHPERVGALLGRRRGEVAWLDEAGVAERLRALRADQSAWRTPADTGQFSLAGAQPKTALLFEQGRWGVPSGRTPTTHILKPPTGEFDGYVLNEHLCLELARALGLPAAHSRVMRFDGEAAIVVERFDRTRVGRRLVRIHQEDVCQAIGCPPGRKYESEGGPGARRIVELLRASSTAPAADVDTFIDALVFAWLIGGTDAHAKNFAVLIGAGPRVRLAPLYDLASALPYDVLDPHRLKLAMKIGGQYLLRRIGGSQWRRLALDVGLQADAVLERARWMTEALPDAAADVLRAARADGLSHPIVRRLGARLTERARSATAALTAAIPPPAASRA